MNWIECKDSQVIEEFAYEDGNLFIRFKKRGNVYKYYSVPERVFDEMRYAKSRGEYFNTYVYDAYRYDEVEIAA